MKKTKTILIIISVIIIAACGSSKKAVTTTTHTPTTTTSTPSDISFLAKPADGVYTPGNEELTAIQIKYKEVTLEKLKEGHAIYTGTCTNCHEAKSIYERSDAEWKDVLDDMAIKANISEAQKDAVYKYVLSIKAAQPKGGK